MSHPASNSPAVGCGGTEPWLHEDAARRAEQMRLLIEVGQRLSAILDLDRLLEAIMVEVKAAFHCSLVVLGLIEGERLQVASVAGAEGLARPPEDMAISVDVGLSGWVIQHKEPLYVPDVTTDPRYHSPQSMQHLAVRSALVVPILLGGRILGVLDVESERPAAFDCLDVTLLQTVANQAAVAIGNAQTYAQAEQRAAMLRALLSTTQELNSTLDLRQLLEVIAGQARTLIEVDCCDIFLLNAETGILTPVVAHHAWADEVLGLTLKLGQGITGHVAMTGVGEIVNRADRDPRAVMVPNTPIVPEALLAAPLRYKGKVIGVMTLSRLGEHKFSPTDLELLNSFASQAAVAVENARLYTESCQHARRLEQAHARLLEAQNQLLQAEKLSAIGQLAAGMAHELNNPLTAIMGFAQLLEAESLSPTGRSDLRRILAAVGRAKGIVANLLSFAREQRLMPQPVDLAALVERILKLHSQEFALGHVVIQQELQPELSAVSVDPLQIEQLVLRLVRNAYRSMSQTGGGTLAVRLSQPNSEVARLEVADDGPSIPADVLPHIFDPFYATHDLAEGQGLGLWACFGIVRAHKGRIWAETRPEGGTRFIVELPLEADADEPPQAPADHTVLIVSANDDLVRSLLPIVEGLGHQASWVESGEAALAEIVVRRYDLVLCDVTLPGMGIRPLYESVAANDPGLATRFLAVGGPREAAPAGVTLIEVPIEPSRVQEIVRAAIAGGP